MRILIAAALLATPAFAHAADLPAGADGSATAAEDGVAPPAPREGDGIPDQLDSDQKAGYRKVFAAIRAQRWQDAQLQLDSMKPGPLHAIARAELYTAKNSPKVELAPLLQLIGDAPELPQADQLSRMARTRGAMTTPAIPAAARLIWYDGAPVRQRARSIKSDTAATEIALAIQPYVKADQGAEAEGVVAKSLVSVDA